MAKSKKYVYRVVQDKTSWTTEIIRRVTSKKTVVTKSQSGFPDVDEAEEWGKSQVKEFVKTHNLIERNKRRSKEREQEQ